MHGMAATHGGWKLETWKLEIECRERQRRAVLIVYVSHSVVTTLLHHCPRNVTPMLMLVRQTVETRLTSM